MIYVTIEAQTIIEGGKIMWNGNSGYYIEGGEYKTETIPPIPADEVGVVYDPFALEYEIDDLHYEIPTAYPAGLFKDERPLLLTMTIGQTQFWKLEESPEGFDE